MINKKLKIIMLVIILLFFSTGILFLKAKITEIDQPILFNHKKHIEEADLDCNDCHLYYQKYDFSGKPGIDICLSCHEEALTESPEEEKIREYAKEGKDIDWKRIYILPNDVHYSHRRHVVSGKLECKVCHGNIAQSEEPPKRPKIKISMGKCINCHKERNVTTDCISCHK